VCDIDGVNLVNPSLSMIVFSMIVNIADFFAGSVFGLVLYHYTLHISYMR